MVKIKETKIKYYICDICGKAFKTAKHAEKCEAKGIALQWWDDHRSPNEPQVWRDELEIGDILMQDDEGRESGRGIDQSVIVGFVPKGHQIWLVVESPEDPEPQEMDPMVLDGSYVVGDKEINNTKWLFERSDWIKEKHNESQA